MIYDISLSLHDGMVTWPGDPVYQREHFLSLEAGDAATVSKISMGVHTGTHIDAPAHFLVDGKTIDQVDLDVCMGPCQVISCEGEVTVTGELLRERVSDECTRLLIKTDNSRLWEMHDQVFHQDFVALDETAARYVTERDIKLVGVDYLSVEGFHAEEGNPVHHVLLEAGTVILEGLNLHDIKPGDYTLHALPLKIEGSEGAPCRAVLVD